jgi:hypothetical protein
MLDLQSTQNVTKPLSDARLKHLQVRVASVAERSNKDLPGDWLHELLDEVYRLRAVNQRVAAVIQDCETCIGYGDAETIRIFRGIGKRLKSTQEGQ